MSDLELEDEEKPKLTHGILIGMLEKAKFYKSEEGWGFLDMHLDGVKWGAVSINSRRFEALVYGLASKLDLGFPTTNMMKDVRAWAAAQVEMSKPRNVTHRVNGFGEKLVYDLATENEEFVVWEDGRWDVVSGSWPFMRGGATRPQVLPVHTNKKLIDMLRPLVNCSDDDLNLIAGWLLGCFKTGGPYPVLALHGMQGSAKTTTSRLLKRLVDPHGLTFSDPPKSAAEILTIIGNRFLVVFDNLSYVNANFSDLLCKVATKATISTRELYSNGIEIGIEATRPVILNGIPTFTERPDLVDRMIQVTLLPIDKKGRKTDDEYWKEVDAVFPELLGALYNAVGEAQFNSRSHKLETSHRMSNFIHWASSALGEPFIKAYDRAMKMSVSDSVEGNTLAMAIIMLMRKQEEWVGSMSELQTVLAPFRHLDDPTWPTTPKGLSAALKRNKPTLRAACLEYDVAGRETTGGYRRNLHRIKRTREWAGQEFSSEVSIV